MKRLFVLAVGSLLSASLFTAAYAAQAAAPGKGTHQQGLKNAKKVMKARFDREKKMAEVRKQAQAKKHQAQGGK
jgi:hypothetical protein